MRTTRNSPRTAELSAEIQEEIRKRCTGELRTDLVARILFSTDASLYQIEPLGVYTPRTEEDVAAVVEICARNNVPVLPRGSGSSLAGQAVGKALIIDCSKYLRQKIQIDPETKTVVSDPGVNLNNINRAAGAFGLMLGPDPASADRATVGGSVANNATGAHSILFGMFADHVLGVKAVLADGRITRFQSQSLEAAKFLGQRNDQSIETRLFQAALEIRQQHTEMIKQNWPKVWRRASGYGIHYLLPWTPSVPAQWDGEWNQEHLDYPPVAAGEINLAPLFAGSEGTLGILTEITLRLVPKPKETILAVVEFEDIHQACDAAVEFLASGPSAIELIPGSLIHLARAIPAYAHQLGFVEGNPNALLVVEYSGDTVDALNNKVKSLPGKVRIAASNADQKAVWNVRSMGLGILNSRPGDKKPLAFIEDVAVPIERLGEFTRQIEKIMSEFGTYGEFYAHASAGCLHIRPVLNPKNGDDIKRMRQIATETVRLAIDLGGTVSGEHGDGLARSEWMERLFGPEIIRVFEGIKTAADPNEIMNPGKILAAQRMDENLRFQDYQVRAWVPALDFSNQVDMPGAIEMCNGAGVCRKENGLMCPSFQATREEEHSTRGRANLLRALIFGKFPEGQSGEGAVFNALDLCLACKGCRSECPSSVDLAKLKYEFLHHYYETRPRQMRDYLFANIDTLARWGVTIGWLVNRLSGTKLTRRLGEQFFGISRQRRIPELISHSQQMLIEDRQRYPHSIEDVFFLSDAFSRYFHPQTESAGLDLLRRCAVNPRILPILGAGRTLISKGFLDEAKQHLQSLLTILENEDPESKLAIVGVEPSEIYTLRDELVELFPNDPRAEKLAKRAWMVEEYLLRQGEDQIPRINRRAIPGSFTIGRGQKVLFHGHCYQKSRPPADDGYPIGVSATLALLRSAGYEVENIEAGCCGMAGGFGYEAEHYGVSMTIGEQALFPAIRGHGEPWIVAAAGTSCRSQIADGTGRQALHPLELFL